MGTSPDSREAGPVNSPFELDEAAEMDLELTRRLVIQADVLEHLIGNLFLMFATERSLEAVQQLHDSAAAWAAQARAGNLVPPAPGLSPVDYWERRERILRDAREKAEICLHGPSSPEPIVRLACVAGHRVDGA